MIRQISIFLEGLSKELEYLGLYLNKPTLCFYYRIVRNIRDKNDSGKYPDEIMINAKREFYDTKCYIRNLEKMLLNQDSKEYAKKLKQCRYALKESMAYKPK